MACRTVRAKRELVRIVRSPEGTLSVDLRGKASGRGAYVCPDPACLARGLSDGAIARALETQISADVAERLKSELEDASRVRTEQATSGLAASGARGPRVAKRQSTSPELLSSPKARD